MRSRKASIFSNDPFNEGINAKTAIIVIIIVVGLVVGASYFYQGGNFDLSNLNINSLSLGSNNYGDEEGFIGGDQDLDVAFVANNPPSQVVDTDVFDIVVKLENMGEYTLPEDEVFVKLSNSEIFGIEDNLKKNPADLSGVYRTDGVTVPSIPEYIEFSNAQFRGQAPLSEESPIPISVEVCYPYSSTAVANLCFSKGFTSLVCSPKGSIPVDNSGAAVQVTNIEQLSSQGKKDGSTEVKIQVTVEQVGSGWVYNPSLSCDDNIYIGLDRIDIKEIRLGSKIYSNPLDICTKDELIFDSDGKDNFRCIFKIDNAYGDFNERLEINMDYKRVITKNKIIEVVPFSQIVPYADTVDSTSTE